MPFVSIANDHSVTTQACTHAHPHADSDSGSSYTRIQRLAWFFEAHFGEVELHMPEETEPDEQENGEATHDPALIVRVDDADAHINLVSLVCLSVCWVIMLIIILVASRS